MIRTGEKKVGKNNSGDVRDQDGLTPPACETGHFRPGLKRPVTYTSGSPVSSAAYANQRPSAELLVPISEDGPRRRGWGWPARGPSLSSVKGRSQASVLVSREVMGPSRRVPSDVIPETLKPFTSCLGCEAVSEGIHQVAFFALKKM